VPPHDRGFEELLIGWMKKTLPHLEHKFQAGKISMSSGPVKIPNPALPADQVGCRAAVCLIIDPQKISELTVRIYGQDGL